MSSVYIDIGNTRAKWMLIHDGGEETGVVALGDEPYYEALRNIAGDVSFVGVSCVRGQQFMDRFSEAAKLAWGVEPCFAETSAAQRGLVCGYDEISRLGVDRWLVMLAAWDKYHSPLCVVDCGSAITIDIVSQSGKHQGGYILPGLRIGVSSLLNNTDKVIVDFDKFQGATLALGKNTTDAVYHGALFSLEANISSAMQVLSGLDSDCEGRLILTGGDGVLVSGLTAQKCEYDEGLVLRGLKLYFDNN